MKSITLRGIDEKLSLAIESAAKKEHRSINKTNISLFRKALGFAGHEEYPEYDDLDDLAGTWSQEDEDGFNEAVSDFKKIDEEIWK